MRHWLPDVLSLSRVPLAFMLLQSYRIDTRGLAEALLYFAIAAFTDKLDGAVARRLGVASYHGYLVDGFADRTFSAACILVATVHHALPLWVALMAITREMLLYTCRLIDPSRWHPPSRGARLHSLAVFGVTRLWFLALIAVGLVAPTHAISTLRVWSILNAGYSMVLAVSVLLLSDNLLRGLARCFDDEPS